MPCPVHVYDARRAMLRNRHIDEGNGFFILSTVHSRLVRLGQSECPDLLSFVSVPRSVVRSRDAYQTFEVPADVEVHYG